MLDYCTKTICSIEKEDNNYILKNCNKKNIWKTEDDISEFSQALAQKTRTYIESCQDPVQGTGFASDNQMVWILAIKTKKNERLYKNIAVCKYFKYAINEINVHIKQLIGIIQDNLTKTKKYQRLWSDEVSEVEFLEVNIDKYIEMQNELHELQKNAPYIYSLISMNENDKTESSRNILRKNQAEFIEGKIASNYNLKDSGIWHPSSLGIDGEIYSYYNNISNSGEK